MKCGSARVIPYRDQTWGHRHITASDPILFLCISFTRALPAQPDLPDVSPTPKPLVHVTRFNETQNTEFQACFSCLEARQWSHLDPLATHFSPLLDLVTPESHSMPCANEDNT